MSAPHLQAVAKRGRTHRSAPTFFTMRYGLIAGNGRFPFMVVEGARRAGVSAFCRCYSRETVRGLKDEVDRLTWVGIGQLGKMIRFFKGEGVEKAIMAGQVRHVPNL